MRPTYPIDDVNKIRILYAQFQVVNLHLRVDSILKAIYDFILKKSRINDIGLDVGKGLQDNIKRHDLLHTDFRPIECEGCKK